MKKIFLLFAVFILGLFINLKCYAYNPEITNYYINIVVKRDKSFIVNESIKALFYSKMHFMYRVIPLEGFVIRENGKNEEYSAKISEINTNKDFISYKDSNNFLHIKMGNNKDYAIGPQMYEIQYVYKMSPDKLKTKDEFYFNIVDGNWEVPISNVFFSIKMPKHFDKKNVHFYDKFGESPYVNYKVENDYITGKYNHILYPKDSLVIKIDLPEGYFIKTFADIFMPMIDMCAVLFPIFILGVVALLRYTFKRKASKPDEFDGNLPNEYSAIDLAYVYYHDIDNSFIPSLIIQLANKGFLQIEESDELDSKNDFKLTKTKIYDGNDPNEKLFMNAIFKNNIDFITSKELYKNKYDIESAAKKITQSVKQKLKKVIEKKTWTLKNTIACFMILTWFWTCVYIGVKIGFGWFLFHLIFLPIISYLLLQTGIIRYIQKRTNAALLIFFGILTTIITLATLGNAVIVNTSAIVLPFFVSLACLILMDVMRFNSQYRSKEEDKIYRKADSIKRFIEQTDSEKLQRIVNKNPFDFYKFIPYAQVFGLTKIWFKKYESTICPPPKYYSGKLYGNKSFADLIINALNLLSDFCAPSGKR